MLMAIRVLHVIGGLGLGGAQVCLKYLVENKSDDVECYVYPLRHREETIPIDGEIIDVRYPNYDPRKFFKMVRLCKELKIDVIHAHLHKPIMGALLAKYFCDVKVVAHEHGAIAHHGGQYGLYRAFLRMFGNKADVFISPSKAVVGQLVELGGVDEPKIEVVYNAVDLEKFQPKQEVRQALRKEFGIGEEDIVVGFIGRLAEVKGPDILLEAFEKVVKRDGRFVLVYVGAGPMREELEKRAAEYGIAERVRMLGYRKDVADVINVFDVAAITSRQDAFPLTPLEVLSMRVPLVSCDVYGLAEVVEHEVNALVPEGNGPGEIAECILRVAGDGELRAKLVEQGGVTAERFGIDRCVERVEEIYRKLKIKMQK